MGERPKVVDIGTVIVRKGGLTFINWNTQTNLSVRYVLMDFPVLGFLPNTRVKIGARA